MGEMKNAYRILAGKHERMRLRKGSWPRWKYIIKMDFQEIDYACITEFFWLKCSSMASSSENDNE
jgi:hypothetical protein